MIDGNYGLSRLVVSEVVTRWIDCLEPADNDVEAESHAMVRVDATDLHVLQFPGEGVLPLLLLHGWPTSFLLFHRLIGELRKAYSELLPVLMPGFGTPLLPRASWSELDSSKLLLKMLEALGFRRFAAHGEVWGSTVARDMGSLDPDRVADVHVSAGLHEILADGTVEDKAWRDLEQHATDGSAYLRLQTERLDSLTFTLTDSPVGLLARQFDKYSLRQGILGGNFGIGDDFIFANATPHSLTNSISTSIRLHARSRSGMPPTFSPTATAVNKFGLADFTSRAASERHNNLVAWHEHDTGGQMAALDAEKELKNDLNDFMHQIGARS